MAVNDGYQSSTEASKAFCEVHRIRNHGHRAAGAVVGVAVLIATDPTLVYYSRFMRNDVLVAGASLAGATPPRRSRPR